MLTMRSSGEVSEIRQCRHNWRSSWSVLREAFFVKRSICWSSSRSCRAVHN